MTLLCIKVLYSVGVCCRERMVPAMVVMMLDQRPSRMEPTAVEWRTGEWRMEEWRMGELRMELDHMTRRTAIPPKACTE